MRVCCELFLHKCKITMKEESRGKFGKWSIFFFSNIDAFGLKQRLDSATTRFEEMFYETTFLPPFPPSTRYSAASTQMLILKSGKCTSPTSSNTVRLSTTGFLIPNMRTISHYVHMDVEVWRGIKRSYSFVPLFPQQDGFHMCTDFERLRQISTLDL